MTIKKGADDFVIISPLFLIAAIAAELAISENTVRFHLKNVYEKLEVTNRTEAAAWFLRDGEVS